MALLDSFMQQKVELTISLFGVHRTIKGLLLDYQKPWVKLQIAGVTRVFNENTVKEIVPC